MIVGLYLVTVTQAGTPLAACPSLPIALDTTVLGELTTCAGAAYVFYTFQGVAGQPIAVELASTEFDPAMTLSGPPGYRGPFSGSTLVDSNDDYAGGTNARMPSSGNFTPLPVNGLYTLVIDNNGAPNARGKFTLTTRSSAEYCKFSLPNALRLARDLRPWP